MAKAWRKHVITIGGEDLGAGDYITFNTKDGEYFHNAKIIRITFWIDGSSRLTIDDHNKVYIIDVNDIIEE